MKYKTLFNCVFRIIICFIFVFTSSAHADNKLEQLHIIDWHVHIAGLGYGESGNFINQQMRDNFRFGFFMKWMNVNEEELKQYGDEIVVKRLNDQIELSKYVDQAIVLALDGVIDPQSGQIDKSATQFYVDNDFVAEQTKKYPSLLFGASINPKRGDAIQRLDRVVKQGAVLIKWIPSIMYIDPSDQSFIPFYQRMAEYNIPLLSHTGMERSFATAKDELADPRKLELPLSLGVTVIAAHIATTGESHGQDNFERILPMFDEYNNLYTDISSLTQINKLGYLSKALKYPGLSEHMIYGTDWPLQYFPVVSPWYHIRHIGVRNAWKISKIKSKWDRDIRLKQAFGVSKEVFQRRLGILNIQ